VRGDPRATHQPRELRHEGGEVLRRHDAILDEGDRHAPRGAAAKQPDACAADRPEPRSLVSVPARRPPRQGRQRGGVMGKEDLACLRVRGLASASLLHPVRTQAHATPCRQGAQGVCPPGCQQHRVRLTAVRSSPECLAARPRYFCPTRNQRDTCDTPLHGDTGRPPGHELDPEARDPHQGGKMSLGNDPRRHRDRRVRAGAGICDRRRAAGRQVRPRGGMDVWFAPTSRTTRRATKPSSYETEAVKR
jgi:hypothetical protein